MLEGLNFGPGGESPAVKGTVDYTAERTIRCRWILSEISGLHFDALDRADEQRVPHEWRCPRPAPPVPDRAPLGACVPPDWSPPPDGTKYPQARLRECRMVQCWLVKKHEEGSRRVPYEPACFRGKYSATSINWFAC